MDDALSHDVANDTPDCNKRRPFPRDANNIDAADRPIELLTRGTTRTRIAIPVSTATVLPPASCIENVSLRGGAPCSSV